MRNKPHLFERETAAMRMLVVLSAGTEVLGTNIRAAKAVAKALTALLLAAWPSGLHYDRQLWQLDSYTLCGLSKYVQDLAD